MIWKGKDTKRKNLVKAHGIRKFDDGIQKFHADCNLIKLLTFKFLSAEIFKSQYPKFVPKYTTECQWRSPNFTATAIQEL